MEFRKEGFEMQFQFYKCIDSGEQFTDDDLDEVNINQVYNQYREKYGIPFPEEIKAIRAQYGLPANKMSEILGIGINAYRNYESGEVPSVSNGRLIQIIKDPKEFRHLIELSRNEFSINELERIHKKIIIASNKNEDLDSSYENYIMLGDKRPSIMNGYRVPNLDKVKNMVLYFAEKTKPYKTKLNKLLFYADFLQFKKSYFSISGLTYQAIQKGPVPKNYDWIFDKVVEEKKISIILHDYGNYMGEQFVPIGENLYDKNIFTASELDTLQRTVDAFENDTINNIVSKSHEEDAWIDNVKNFNLISYHYGLNLKYPTFIF